MFERQTQVSFLKKQEEGIVMKKKLMSVLLAAAMVAATAVPAFAADTVKIGVYEPASGDNGAGGKQETLGIQYANSETPTVEIDGKEYTVELDIVDNESSNDKGPSAAAQLVSDGVSIVLGSYGSGVSIAASDIFKQGGIPAQIGRASCRERVYDLVVGMSLMRIQK